MLDTLTQFFTGILLGLLALMNSTAAVLEHLLVPDDHPGDRSGQMANAEPAPLPSSYDDQSIPDILLQDPQYQQAGVIESDPVRRAYTTDPEAALVNIYCTFTGDRSVRTTTGTGFFINPNGVILTNAHVAQFLLLETLDDFGSTHCVVRSGDPAVDRYQAELLYIPPSWVQQHAAAIVADRPVGTGERDYALLYVAESLSSEPLPALFPALQYNTDLLSVQSLGTGVVAAGYPAAHLSTLGGTAELSPRVATTTVTDLFTFGSNYADVMSLAGSAVGEHGSSGGPILHDGEVTGLITTRGDDSIDGTGSLRAITLSYIDRTLQQETGFTLTESTGGELSFRSHVFKETLAPFLTSLLARELDR